MASSSSFPYYWIFFQNMLIYLRSKYPLRILPWAKVSFWDDTCSLSTIKLPRRTVSTCHLCLPLPITLHPLFTGFCPYLFTTLHFQITRGFFWLNPMPPYSTHLSLLLSGVDMYNLSLFFESPLNSMTSLLVFLLPLGLVLYSALEASSLVGLDHSSCFNHHYLFCI